MGVSIHHIDLAVSDVERSVAFYLGLLGPFGLREAGRFPTYRGTEAWRAYFEQMDKVWEDWSVENVGLRDAGDGRDLAQCSSGRCHRPPLRCHGRPLRTRR